jgi:hypothetical protein
MHMIQNACNLRYKDVYTSCYICHAKCKKCSKESYKYATKELPYTKLTNHRLLEVRQKGLTPPAKEQRSAKTHNLPLNTCTRVKEHTKLTLHTWDREEAKQTKWLDQVHTLEGHKLTYLDHFFTIHSSLSTIPESEVPPCHHWGMRPKNHPHLLTQNPHPAPSTQQDEQSWLNTRTDSKAC